MSEGLKGDVSTVLVLQLCEIEGNEHAHSNVIVSIFL